MRRTRIQAARSACRLHPTRARGGHKREARPGNRQDARHDEAMTMARVGCAIRKLRQAVRGGPLAVRMGVHVPVLCAQEHLLQAHMRGRGAGDPVGFQGGYRRGGAGDDGRRHVPDAGPPPAGTACAGTGAATDRGAGVRDRPCGSRRDSGPGWQRIQPAPVAGVPDMYAGGMSLRRIACNIGQGIRDPPKTRAAPYHTGPYAGS